MYTIKKNNNTQKFLCVYYVFMLLLSLHPSVSYGLDFSNLSADAMLERLSEQIPTLIRLATALAYLMGMFFIIKGVLALKYLGESRTMMSQEHTLKEPVMYLVVGAALLYFPTTVQIGFSTFWTDPNPYGYLDKEDDWSSFMNVCYIIIQFVGVISFIRGLVLLSHTAGNSQQGTMGKAFAHIIGGIFCINIYQFVQVVLATFGLSS